ncbi:MAG: erythromycin esterase family protein [Tissierellia bacterium]|nr:erythromycin esterase family protein [Tissierellia bacterium]
MSDYQLKKYLMNNHNKIIMGEEDIQSLSIIDEDLRDKEIFLTGENHGVKANVELRMKFLKYFKEKIDFKYYLCELPYSTAYFINMYLETGNEDILKEVYTALKGTDAWNKDDYFHWKEVYKYNETLSKDRKITIVGIDIEHQPINALKFMEYCLPEKNTHKKIGEIHNRIINNIDEIKLKDKFVNSKKFKIFFHKLAKDLKDREIFYRSILKENYFGFKFVNQNLLNMYEVYEGNNFNGIRDNKMYQNFVEFHKKLPKGKYYGQLGLSHIFQKSFPYVNWLGAALNKNTIFKGKVLSIAYVYKNCKYLYPTTWKNYISSINTLDSSMGVFEDFINNEYTIFKLNGKNSPFKDKLIWPIAHKFPKDGVTTDYFQYMILIKDSDAMEPLNHNNWQQFPSNRGRRIFKED